MRYKKFYQIIFAIVLYIIINVFFHQQLWAELKFDHSKVNAVYGEQMGIEWDEEKVYQNMKAGKNPFSEVKDILYPFGTNFITTDSGNAFFFPFLRPFMSIHQATSVIWAVQIILANIGMFLLLIGLEIPYFISLAIGFCFGYTTFLMPRIGHMTYFAIYVFPWFYYSFLNLIKNNKPLLKIINSVAASLFFILALYHNLYYFMILILSIVFLLTYLLVKEKDLLFKTLKNNASWLISILIFTVIFAFPWLKVTYETFKFEMLPKTEGWGGAVQYSSDLFGFLIPSIYSYFFGRFSEYLGLRFYFANGMFENYTYPGLIIIGSLFTGLFLMLRKKIKKNDLRLIFPYLFVAFCFWLLTLGPFLHVFGKWRIPMDEDIKIIIPLPYIILHYIPFLNNLRSPGRLIVGFIFFAYIASAYIISFILKDRPKFLKTIFFLLILLVIIIDHYFKYSVSPSANFLPVAIYKTIASDKSKVTVMEAPSVIRDGFTYFGDESGFNFFNSQLIYNKPVLSGYFGRIPSYKREYYIRSPLLGYFGRLMDENIINNGSFDKSDWKNWQKIDINKANNVLNFLDVSYFIIDNTKTYSASISADLINLDFKKTMDEKNFSLWKRNVDQKEYLTVNIGKDDEMYLGMGWYQKENNGRWATDRSSVLFKVVKERKFVLHFDAVSFYKNIPTEIYVDKKKIGNVIISTSQKQFSLPINFSLEKGLHTVYFIFDKSYRTIDGRKLSANFITISLEEDK
ncbi:MAG: hypothetical protein WC741_04275 [Patescibacteria group bacterium]|jgi:hypothetical protein